MQPASRRALGDITNAGGGGSSGSGGLGGGVLKKSQPALVASIKPLSSSSSPAPLKQKAPQQKLSAPIQLVSASSIPSAAALADDDEDLSWMHVDQAKGDGLGHLRALDHAQEEVATQASQALVARLGDGKMFRPNSPIPWERTEEETNYNGQSSRTAQLTLAHDSSTTSRALLSGQVSMHRALFSHFICCSFSACCFL